MTPQSFWDRMASITDESRNETGSREQRRVLAKGEAEAGVEEDLHDVAERLHARLRADHRLPREPEVQVERRGERAGRSRSPKTG